MAIEIRNSKGQIADLNDDTVINVDRNCALFSDDDKLFQDITLPISLPKTPSNLVFFGGGHLVDADNQLYQLPVQVIVNGTTFFNGTAEYNMKDDEFDVQLLVNYASVRDKLKNVLLSDIYDNEQVLPGTVSAIQDLMLQTCLYPERYDFAFFPVYNEYYAGSGYQYPFTNFWNHGTQQFVYDGNEEAGPGGPDQKTTRQSAFYKLKFWIKRVCKCLGFEAVGSFMTDADAEQIYLYTDVSTYISASLTIPYNISLEKFFKLLKQRFQIIVQFNALTGKANVISFKSMLRDTEVINISDYISEIKEIKTPTAKGYTVKLKPDASDVLFKDPNNPDEFIPTNRMVVGDGEKEVSIEASTLKQANTNNDYFYPKTKHRTTYFSNAASAQSIRFLRFVGFKPASGGKVFPTSFTMELGQDEALWYRFLNDGKQLKVIAYFPLTVLEQIDLSKKLFFVADDGTAVYAIVEKESFSLTNAQEELVRAEIICWSANFSPKTEVQFIATQTNAAQGDFKAKAYFNFEGRIEVKIRYPAGLRYYNSSGFPEALTADLVANGFIYKSTDRVRAGGTTVNLPYLSVLFDDFHLVEIQSSIKPVDVVYNGASHTTSSLVGNYWVTKNFTGNLLGRFIFWLKF